MALSKRMFALFGPFELLFPKTNVDFGERLAFRNPDETELWSWSIPAARVEGVAFLRSYRAVSRSSPEPHPLFGFVGVPALRAPSRFVSAAMRIGSRDSATIELTS